MICISRITNAFTRRDRDVTRAETNNDIGCATERVVSQISFPSIVEGLARKDIFEQHKLEEIPFRRDLFEAIEDLCKYTWISHQQNVLRKAKSRFSLRPVI